MKILDERFSELREKKPLWSNFLCLSNAVIGRGYTFNQIRVAFESLVGREEYSLSDKDEILQDLHRKTLLGHA